MNKYKYIIIGLGLLIVVTGYYLVSNYRDNGKHKPIITIGVTLPLTGDVAILGQSSKKAIDLAYEKLPKDLKYDYKLVYEDDQFKPSLGATIANKLINIDNADALISFGSPVGSVVSPIAEKSMVLHINDFVSASNVSDGDYNFVHYTPPYEDSKLFIEQLNKRGIKNIIFFAQQDNQGVAAIIENFEKDITKTNISIISTQKFNTGTRDFRTYIDKVKNLDAQIYVLEATTPELEILTRQIRQSGIDKPITTMEAFEFSDELSLFEGMWYVNGADPTEWFVNLYEDKYSEIPRFGAANAYDVLNLIVKSVEQVGNGKDKPSRKEIRDAMANISEFDGALGTKLTIDKNGVIDSKAVVRQIKDGKAITIEK